MRTSNPAENEMNKPEGHQSGSDIIGHNPPASGKFLQETKGGGFDHIQKAKEKKTQGEWKLIGRDP